MFNFLKLKKKPTTCLEILEQIQNDIKCPKCDIYATRHYSDPLGSVKGTVSFKFKEVPEYQDSEGFWHTASKELSETIVCNLTVDDIILNYQKRSKEKL